jgi:predicted enzyme related to lactoylglutathione lyase
VTRCFAYRVCGLRWRGVDFGGVFAVKLPVTDLARSRHWYEQVFGFTVALEFQTQAPQAGQILAND